MSGIFSKPEEVQHENQYGVKVLFLHGLEGRGPLGNKAKSLSGEWGALCPPLRTQDLSNLRKTCGGYWSIVGQGEKDTALETPYSDAKDAVRYSKPDIIVGSSMGAAILFKLIAEGHYEGTAVFCAPAIASLLSPQLIQKAVDEKQEILNRSVWLLGETDAIVSNKRIKEIARSVGGSVIVSPGDGHRLNKAVESNILNSAVLTALELSL